MSSVKYINPDGQVVEVPEADAAHFDAIGWPKAEGEAEQTPKAKKRNTETNNTK